MSKHWRKVRRQNLNTYRVYRNTYANQESLYVLTYLLTKSLQFHFFARTDRQTDGQTQPKTVHIWHSITGAKERRWLIWNNEVGNDWSYSSWTELLWALFFVFFCCFFTIFIMFVCFLFLATTRWWMKIYILIMHPFSEKAVDDKPHPRIPTLPTPLMMTVWLCRLLSAISRVCRRSTCVPAYLLSWVHYWQTSTRSTFTQRQPRPPSPPATASPPQTSGYVNNASVS